jgi:hypothetical protein
MKPLTLNQKRLVVGIWLLVFLFAVANEYLAWGVFAGSGKLFRVLVMFVGIVAFFRFGSKMLEETDAHNAAKREVDEAAERARDKSNDAAEADQLRHLIGMSSSVSTQTPAQQSVQPDRREDAAPG